MELSGIQPNRCLVCFAAEKQLGGIIPQASCFFYDAARGINKNPSMCGADAASPSALQVRRRQPNGSTEYWRRKTTHTMRMITMVIVAI